MTKAQFITAVEAKPNFIRWAVAPALFETIGTVERWQGTAYVSTPDGTNTYMVCFFVDTVTNLATWQQFDSMEPSKNTESTKINALQAYMKATFDAFFPLRYDLVNDWAEADVYTISGTDLAKSTVLVFKKGTNPITHRKIV